MNSDCLDCISDMNLSPNKGRVNCLIHIMPLIQISPNTGILLRGLYIYKLLNNPITSFYLINLIFLLSQNHKLYILIKGLFLFSWVYKFWVFTFCVLSTISTIRWTDELTKFLDFWFLLSYHHILLKYYLIKQFHHG